MGFDSIQLNIKQIQKYSENKTRNCEKTYQFE